MNVPFSKLDGVPLFSRSGDAKNHLPVFFRNLHPIKYVAFSFEDQSADILVETDSLGSSHQFETILFTFGNEKIDPVVMA